MQWHRSRIVAALALATLMAASTACSGSGAAANSTGPGASASSTSAPTTALTTSAPTTPPVLQRVFPVQGKTSYDHEHHDYPATDIMAACGLPYVAPITGVVLEVDRVDDYDPKTNLGITRGGLSVSLLGDDGVRYYGSHFSAIEAFVAPGVRVTAGERLATVGRTGDASACHVHFGLSPVCDRTGDWWTRRGAIWPWKYLDSWRSGGNLAPLPEIEQWQAASGCPDHPLVDP